MHPRLTDSANANDPRCTTIGMARLCLDMRGRLIEFESGPSLSPSAKSPPAWSSILDLAGVARLQPTSLELSILKTVPGTQERHNWMGVYSDCPEIPCLVEAGLRDNRLQYFHVRPADASDWGPTWLADTPSLGSSEMNMSVQLVVAVFFFATFVIWITFAWHNVRSGRANLHGAVVFGLTFLAVNVGTRLGAIQQPGRTTWFTFEELINILGTALIACLCAALLYVAIEPFVRRRWAWRIVAWNRVLMGRWLDPLVGRDVLVGTAAGVLLRSAGQAVFFLPHWMDQPAIEPTATVSLYWVVRPVLGEVASTLGSMLSNPLYLVLIFFLVYLVTRREWIAASLSIVVPSSLSFFVAEIHEQRIVSMLFTAIVVSVFVGLLLRYGLVAVATATFVRMLTGTSLTFDPNVWYADRSYTVLSIILMLALYGLFVSTRIRWYSWIASITAEPVPA